MGEVNFGPLSYPGYDHNDGHRTSIQAANTNPYASPKKRARLEVFDPTGSTPGGDDFIEFGLFPTQIRDTKQIVYSENLVSGSRTSRPQFELTKSQEISFTIFLNEFGAKREDLPWVKFPTAQQDIVKQFNANQPELTAEESNQVLDIATATNKVNETQRNVLSLSEQLIFWLRTKMVPSGVSTVGAEEGAPPILKLIMGPWFLSHTNLGLGFRFNRPSNVFTCVLTQADITSIMIDPITYSRIRSTIQVTLREFLETPR